MDIGTNSILQCVQQSSNGQNDPAGGIADCRQREIRNRFLRDAGLDRLHHDRKQARQAQTDTAIRQNERRNLVDPGEHAEDW